MRIISIAMLMVVLTGSAAFAESTNRLKLDYVPPSADRLPPTKSAASSSCAAFGPGFAKVAGSDTCVKIGGAVRVDVNGSVGR